MSDAEKARAVCATEIAQRAADLLDLPRTPARFLEPDPNKLMPSEPFKWAAWCARVASYSAEHNISIPDTVKRGAFSFVPPPALFGPTGSGKTQVLYSMIRKLADLHRDAIAAAKESVARDVEAMIAANAADPTKPLPAVATVRQSRYWPRKVSVLFVHGLELISEIVRAVETRTVEKVVKKYRQEDEHFSGALAVLVIDNLIGPRWNEPSENAVALYRILDWRHNECMATVVSSDEDAESFKTFLGEGLYRKLGCAPVVLA